MERKRLEIVFVRHAQSYGNIGLAKSDFHPDDPPLTDEGLLQAKRLSLRFHAGEIRSVYASTLIRTCQTVQPTAEKLRLPIFVMPELMERETVIPGTSLDAVSSLAPNAYESAKSVLYANAAYTLKNETAEESVRRAAYVLSVIRQSSAPGDTVLVASHGAFFGYLIREALGITLPESFAWQADNCSVTRIAFRDGDIPILLCANDRSHLFMN